MKKLKLKTYIDTPAQKKADSYGELPTLSIKDVELFLSSDRFVELMNFFEQLNTDNFEKLNLKTSDIIVILNTLTNSLNENTTDIETIQSILDSIVSQYSEVKESLKTIESKEPSVSARDIPQGPNESYASKHLFSKLQSFLDKQDESEQEQEDAKQLNTEVKKATTEVQKESQKSSKLRNLFSKSFENLKKEFITEDQITLMKVTGFILLTRALNELWKKRDDLINVFNDKVWPYIEPVTKIASKVKGWIDYAIDLFQQDKKAREEQKELDQLNSQTTLGESLKTTSGEQFISNDKHEIAPQSTFTSPEEHVKQLQDRFDSLTDESKDLLVKSLSLKEVGYDKTKPLSEQPASLMRVADSINDHKLNYSVNAFLGKELASKLRDEEKTRTGSSFYYRKSDEGKAEGFLSTKHFANVDTYSKELVEESKKLSASTESVTPVVPSVQSNVPQTQEKQIALQSDGWANPDNIDEFNNRLIAKSQSLKATSNNQSNAVTNVTVNNGFISVDSTNFNK